MDVLCWYYTIMGIILIKTNNNNDDYFGNFK